MFCRAFQNSTTSAFHPDPSPAFTLSSPGNEPMAGENTQLSSEAAGVVCRPAVGSFWEISAIN